MPKYLRNEVLKYPWRGEWWSTSSTFLAHSGSLCCPELWQSGKVSFLRAPAGGTCCRCNSISGMPQNLWIIDTANQSLLRARLTQRAARWEQPWKKNVCPAPLCTDTYRDPGAFSNHGICDHWASCFCFCPVVRVSSCSSTSREGQGRISWLMCVKGIRGWREVVTQSHGSTLISSCQTSSAYFWYRFYTRAHVTHSGPHPQQISAPDCI